MEKRVTVSDIISISEISKWEKRDISFIEAGTGKGKTYFVINTLYEYAKSHNKRILLLVNRSSSYVQFTNEIIAKEKTDVIKIETYQQLEHMKLYKKKNYDLHNYDYIVCDEFHYFLNDSAFSDRTDVAFTQVMENKSAVKIFMSATGENMKRYIKENIEIYIDPSTIEIREYSLPVTYDFINKVSFFYKKERLEDLIKKFIDEGSKAMFFIQSLDMAFNLYEKHKEHCLVNCSKPNKKDRNYKQKKEYYKSVDPDKIKRMLEEERFEEQILITTPCMDSGVNIKDPDVKNIVVFIYDLDTLIQCIGRKRLFDCNDKINLYVMHISNNMLGGVYAEINHKKNQIEYLKKRGSGDYADKYPRGDAINMAIYDSNISLKNSVGKKINPLIEYKYNLILDEINTIKAHKRFAYGKYLLHNLGITNYKLFEEENKEPKIQDYLNKMKEKLLDKQEQLKLAEIVDTKDSSGRPYITIGKLNKYLIENNFEYNIIRKIIKNKTYWMIVKREEVVGSNTII